MFAIGLWWNFAFVGSTAVLPDAARLLERGRLLGFNDFAAGITTALSAILAGVVLGMAGLTPPALVATSFSLLPLAIVFFTNRRVARAHT